MTHEVVVLCNCDDIEQCKMETYVSDIRILVKLLEQELGDASLAERVAPQAAP